MTKRSIYQDEPYSYIVDRINRLTPDSTALWGEMSVDQMLAHCTEVQDVLLGKPLEGSPWYFKPLGRLVKKLILSSKPFPRGTTTHPQYVVGDPRVFDSEKSSLLKSLATFKEMSVAEHDKIVHVLFGPMSIDEKGWMCYKHLDHHLNQFGV